jgi:hypothetical protein
MDRHLFKATTRNNSKKQRTAWAGEKSSVFEKAETTKATWVELM